VGDIASANSSSGEGTRLRKVSPTGATLGPHASYERL